MTDTGTVIWSELMTTEVEKAKAFYGETLGLGFEVFGDTNPGYWLATFDGRPVPPPVTWLRAWTPGWRRR
ncbi:MAG: hypothetical protein NTZ54_09125 [Alphaproteobacteria bacterium]|nr:hypothetical protein [Alphaproteobacteria bacterium]